MIALTGNLLVTALLISSLISLSRQMNRLRNSWNRSSMHSENVALCKRLLTILKSPFRLCRRNRNIGESAASSPLNMRSSRNNSSDDMTYNLQIQALLYIASFLVCYLFSFIFRLYIQYTGSSPFVLVLIGRTLNPLQGFFNVIIYTRIQVSRLRSRSDISWLQAFWIVISSGDNNSQRAASDASIGQRSNFLSRLRFFNRSSRRKSSNQTERNEEIELAEDDIPHQECLLEEDHYQNIDDEKSNIQYDDSRWDQNSCLVKDIEKNEIDANACSDTKCTDETSDDTDEQHHLNIDEEKSNKQDDEGRCDQTIGCLVNSDTY